MAVRKVQNVELGTGRPKICIPIMGTTTEEMKEQAKAAEKTFCDMIEIRGDYLTDGDEFYKIKETLTVLRKEAKETPLLFTFRTSAEGGKQEISEGKYKELIKKVCQSGLVDLVDIELFGIKNNREFLEQLKEYSVLLVASNHDFTKTLPVAELEERFEAMVLADADICKIAMMPQDFQDVLRLMQVTAKMKEKYPKKLFVSMSMGKIGMISRVCGELSGSAITFGCIEKSSAPGQIEVTKLQELLAFFGEKESNIYLIGFMGTGKSTIAKKISADYGYNLIEMDEEIEAQQKRRISDIFSDEGEEYFRNLETAFLKELSAVEKTIISCGGGAVLRKENVEYMKRTGKIILLTASAESIYERVKQGENRPVLKGRMNVEAIRQLMEQRRNRYEEVADVVVSTEDRSIEQISSEIIEKMKKNG